MVLCTTISAVKANRLFWLGRYVERAYLNLHLLRRYYDQMIDGDPAVYEEYYKKLDAPYASLDTNWPFLGLVYDEKNPCSLLSGLEAANDNGIVLREEITSETLSYVQLSLVLVKKCAAEKQRNITLLQPVTDYLLALWGSMEERVSDERVLNLVQIGRWVENMDMHVRFDYPVARIKEAYEKLKYCAQLEEGIFDRVMLGNLDNLLSAPADRPLPEEHKGQVLQFINRLVLL
ncbi:MAG: alpha-E domain-containing protein [Parabacteroides sp.]